MPLTPADVHNVAFSKPPIGKRGYNEDEVDAFLDLVEGELATLIETNARLEAEVRQLESLQETRGQDAAGERRLAAVPSFNEGPAAMALGGDHHVQAAKVLGLAQEMADRLTGEAKSEADGMLADARTKAEQLLSDARSKADTMLNDAKTQADALERNARDKAAAMDMDAKRRHAEAMTAINTEKTMLENKIEVLRTMEHEYRTRLKDLLESQLAELNGQPAPAQGGYAFSGARAEAG